jgi:hypothetical protein
MRGMTGARNSRLTRLALRLAGKSSADPRDIHARLDAALRAHGGDDQKPPRSIQVVGEAHLDPETYRKWRERQLRRIPGAFVPELDPGQWGLVLWALRPAVLVDFARHGKTKGLVGPPFVGRFTDTADPDTALAGTLAGWLEAQDGPLALAPPLLRDARGPYRLTPLGRTWALPATELLAALPGSSAPD